AAAGGVLSALLAAEGYTAAADVLEAHQGFIEVCHGRTPDVDHATTVLGDAPAVVDTLFKYHAACYLTHATIENARRLRDDLVVARHQRRRPHSNRRVRHRHPRARPGPPGRRPPPEVLRSGRAGPRQRRRQTAGRAHRRDRLTRRHLRAGRRLAMTDFDPAAFPLVQKGHQFEEFTVGRVFEHHWGRTITDGDNALFSTAMCNWN